MIHPILFSLRVGLTALLLTAAVGAARAQNVGIGTTQPDASAALEIKATNRGLLPPRLTYTQRGDISSPAQGLLVYQTDGSPGYYYYTGTTWLNLGTNTVPDALGRVPLPESFGEVSTFAGSGAGVSNGPLATATFNQPSDVAIDAQGTLYVVDQGNFAIRVIRNGQVSVLAGTGSSAYVNGPAASASFVAPRAIAVDATGTAVYVTDDHRIRLIQNGQVSTLAGTGAAGYQDGPAGSATFQQPGGLAVDAQGTVYVADRANHAIRLISNGEVSTLSGGTGPGNTDGPVATATFNSPSDVAVNAAGTLYVADANNARIRLIRNGQVSTLVSGTLGPAQHLAVDALGNLFYSYGQNVVVWVNRRQRTVANNQAGYVDGPAGTSRFNFPGGLAVDASGTLYVADTQNHRLRRVGGSTTPLPSVTGQTLSLGTGTSVVLPAPTVSLSGQTLSVAGGGSVTLPAAPGDNLGNHTATGPLKYSTNDADKIWFTDASGANGSKLEHAAGWLLNYYAGPNNGLAGTHRFLTGTGSGWRERMRIDDSGNVGIGTADPQRTLDVNGSIRQTTYSYGSLVTMGPGTVGQFDWTHNLGYQPTLMITLDQTGGSGAEYVTVSYEHLNANTVRFRLRNARGTDATFNIRWIRVD